MFKRSRSTLIVCLVYPPLSTKRSSAMSGSGCMDGKDCVKFQLHSPHIVMWLGVTIENTFFALPRCMDLFSI